MNHLTAELWEHVNIHGYDSEWSTYLLELVAEGIPLTEDEQNILAYEVDEARHAFLPNLFPRGEVA